MDDCPYPSALIYRDSGDLGSARSSRRRHPWCRHCAVSDSLARDNPEFAGLQAPLLALALAICVCAGTALVATVLTATMLPFIPGPPALALLIIGSVLVGITLFLVLSVLRSQLRRAVLMRVELDEVV